MNTELIKEKLTELLWKHMIVFWNDANADFIAPIEIPNPLADKI